MDPTPTIRLPEGRLVRVSSGEAVGTVGYGYFSHTHVGGLGLPEPMYGVLPSPKPPGMSDDDFWREAVLCAHSELEPV